MLGIYIFYIACGLSVCLFTCSFYIWFALIVEDLKSKKEELIKQFADIKSQIKKINGEILGYNQITSIVSSLNLEEKDLSIRKLGEYQSHLRSLQKEKETLHSFMRFFRTGPC
ncbi:putative microtubule-associated protein, MAP65/Ase1/PRC1 [Helianthus annuus]|uniref:Microtubule-associated protein, MAP65/Ase1/PRC1 n=1 Tax=Helianthus annuus TaxID=4232 RepID=A0A251TAX6_HELAN|nr:putative microtubule-associated protein, MAP65/Ase1/PRC1 [Helianthus annuus]KAJ0502304.1 putative microtubule-associated protein, MAP65/Ase1/PRC1 [Helianthus annuus]KAJ0510338.1 putative microtubule-associated protein, MAP65/Ase1/PRC1 [Helianthus annuus]KAJ0518226.1 putative microtubule-associated protein, MAP65/Ase1/PRC1 [Helianthus annuus]KAJ0686256.1 putative microtubule-associated protein, MAP65/Ase1/PRC1 [Helianthus annuus]